MKILITLFFPLFFLNGDIAEPSESHKDYNPDWVMEIMDKHPKFTRITKCVYKDIWVWKVNSCVTCNDMITKVYDADKNLICLYGGILRKDTCKDLDVGLEDCQVIYRPKGF